jgi:hypothetical protein
MEVVTPAGCLVAQPLHKIAEHRIRQTHGARKSVAQAQRGRERLSLEWWKETPQKVFWRFITFQC